MINQLSHIGTYHLFGNGENEDAVCHGVQGELSVISLADGVSSCKEAKKGADIASRAITQLLTRKGDYFLAFDDGQIIEFALSHILCELRRKAEEEEKDVSDYSSTVASVLYDQAHKKLLCFNLGDGIIMGVEHGHCRILAMPSDSSDGCCVTTTTGAHLMTSVRVMDVGNMESIIICTDGAWRQMFHRNRLKPEVAAMLASHELDALKEFLLKQNSYDDYSFISMDLQWTEGRRSA